MTSRRRSLPLRRRGAGGLAAAVVVAALIVAPASVASANDVPLAARLLAEPFETTGVRVSVSNMGNMAGLATDGVRVYMLREDGVVVTTPLSDIPLTPGSVFSATGTTHTVGWGVDGAPSRPGDIMRLSIAYSHGCLWITSGGNTAGSIGLTCIDVADWSVTNVPVPVEHPLPVGYYFTYSSLIDFPDGRIGKVSQYEPVTGGYESVLRTYTVTGEGSAATIAWSQDYRMFDPDFWATDEHGIATDGTYLYRIQWRSYDPNTKVWALTAGDAAQVVYEGPYTMPFDNMHYLAHNHSENYYLVGHYNGSSFFITTAADPGPGPGNPLTPALGTVDPTVDGCTIVVTNFDTAYTWGVSSTSGNASLDESGVISLTGLDRDASTTLTVTTQRDGYPNGSQSITCTALPATAPTAPQDVTAKSELGQVSIAWNPPADDGGSPVTGYEVEVRDDAGDPIAGATCSTTVVLYCTVTGLVDGLTYRVAVRAVNAIDAGPWAAEQTIVSGGVRDAGLPGDGDSADLAVDDDTPVERQTVVLTAEGFRPGTQVDFWLHSDPTWLGSSIANGDGVAERSVALPQGAIGPHTVQALGVGPAAGDDRNLSRGIVISAASDGLAATGAQPDAVAGAAIAFFVIGTGLLLARRRPLTV